MIDCFSPLNEIFIAYTACIPYNCRYDFAGWQIRFGLLRCGFAQAKALFRLLFDLRCVVRIHVSSDVMKHGKYSSGLNFKNAKYSLELVTQLRLLPIVSKPNTHLADGHLVNETRIQVIMQLLVCGNEHYFIRYTTGPQKFKRLKWLLGNQNKICFFYIFSKDGP